MKHKRIKKLLDELNADELMYLHSLVSLVNQGLIAVSVDNGKLVVRPINESN